MQHFSTGIWRHVRLELAPTPEFPEGSASRAYMLHLPLEEDGIIDKQALDANPVLADFRRFWPSEPDRKGRIIRLGDGWALSFTGADGGHRIYPIEMDRLLPGNEVTIGKHDGGRWTFRVADLQRDSKFRS